MKKILFGITSLSIGGAERVLVDICNKLCNDYDIEILTLYGNGEFEKLINKNIKLKSIYNYSFNDLSIIKRVLISLKIMFFSKCIYKKYVNAFYDTEVAFLEGPIAKILSSKNKNTKKIAWIHNDISLVFGNGIKSKIKKILNKRVYNKYQELIFVSNHNLKKFNETYRINVNKKVIHNYLNKENVITKSKEFSVNFIKSESPNFLTVCRLVEQKAVERLIDVHHKLIREGYLHTFYVVGDGPLRNNLENKIKSLNISNSFFLLGQKENPYPYILNCNYFCLLSYYEGLPMVLLEAKALNKFILITDTASKEALQNYDKKAIFKNTEEGIYKGLKNIIKEKKDILNNKYIDENDIIIEKIKEVLGE